MKNLIFCNHAHHGDVFIARGLVQDLLTQLPNWDIKYAAYCNPKILKDLVPCLDPNDARNLWPSQYHLSPVLSSHDNTTILVNTWVGAYQGQYPGGHPPFVYLYKIFGQCYDIINKVAGTNLILDSNMWRYVPDIDYSKYDVTSADQFLSNHEKVYLFCNGSVHSMQSSMQNMKDLIEFFANKYPNITFLATEKYETSKANVKFTSDIFHTDNDLCEISYISTKVNLIVGRNSGPFSFANTRRNLRNCNKIYVNFSHHGYDTLPYGLDIAADFRHTNTLHWYYAIEALDQAIQDELTNNQLSGFKYV